MYYYKKQAPLIPPSKKSLNILRRNKYRVITIGFLVGFISGLMHRLVFGENIHCLRVMFLESPIMLAQESPQEWLMKDPLDIVGLPDEDVGQLENSSFLLFTGVMTADAFLSTRAVAVYETWGRHLLGRIGFFSSENSLQPEKYPFLPVVRLKGVDDVYPPQVKAYEMLRYMYKNYGRYFEWFLRADDDVYVKVDKLEEFLKSLDSSVPYYIGQTGTGNPDKAGQLGLGPNDNFCMGGPGVIFSRAMLAMMYPHIDRCIKDLNTTEEDVELGLCITRYLNYQCVWAFDIVKVFTHDVDANETIANNTFRSPMTYSLITLHPLKNSSQLYVFDNFHESNRMQDLHLENAKLHRDIYEMDRLLKKPVERNLTIGDTYILGQPLSLRKFIPRSEDEVISWDILLEKAISSEKYLNPMQTKQTAIMEGHKEAETLAKVYFSQNYEYHYVAHKYFTYIRTDPIHGFEFILNQKMSFPGGKGNANKNHYFQRAFTGIEIRETFEGIDVDEEDEEDQKDSSWFSTRKKRQRFENLGEKFINIIITVSGKYPVFVRFMSMMEELCFKKSENVTLTVVLYKTKDLKVFEKSLGIINDNQAKYPYTNITAVVREDEFSRGVALEAGVAVIEDNDQALMVFMDVDMLFDEDFLYRIRANTIQGKTVFFPINYNEYDPKIIYNKTTSSDHFLVDEDSGYWLDFGYGIACTYKSDLIKVGGFNTTVRGWGGEDVMLFDQYVSYNMTILRSAEPGLVHVFHSRSCDPNLTKEQYEMCMGTMTDSIVGVNQLSKLIYTNRDLFLKFSRKIHLDKPSKKKNLNVSETRQK